MTDSCAKCHKIGVKLYKFYKYDDAEVHLLSTLNNVYCKRCLDDTAAKYKSYTVEYDEQNMTYSFVNNDTNMELVGAIP